MAITVYTESTLGTSEVYAGINSMNPDEPSQTDKAKELIRTAKHLTNEDIEAAYISVKQISDSLTRAALKAFDEGSTVLIYNNVPEKQVTQALPFITFKTASGYKTYVFMDRRFVSVNRDGVLVVQAPILRDLLIGALISTGLKNNYKVLSSNDYLQNILTEMYVKFFVRIINREYSIMADKVLYDTVQYWISRFFLTRILGSTDTAENIETISKKNFKYIDELKYEEIKNTYEAINPAKISDLLKLIGSASSRMKTLSMGIFVSGWINYYYPPAMLAIDNIEYLIFMTISLMSGNGIVSISASDVVKEAKNIKSYRSELLKLI